MRSDPFRSGVRGGGSGSGRKTAARVGVAVAWGLAIGLTLAPASAQTLPVGDPVEDYLRVLQLVGKAKVGSFTVRPLPSRDVRAFLLEGHPWQQEFAPEAAGDGGPVHVEVHAPRLRGFANSRFPLGQNDGVVWQGRGLTTALDGAATVRWRGMSATVRPTLLYTHNSAFDLAPVAGSNPYAYPWRLIDIPQQFGAGGFWTVDPGQSEVRLSRGGLTVGAATGNLWWGPATRNAIIMGNNAPGFPHVFVGTNGPVGIGIGDLEARWIWGRLSQSDWFEPGSDDPGRFITGVAATYSPSFLPGLSLGVTRVFYRLIPDGGVPFGDYFSVFQGVRKKTLGGDDEADQMLSVFGRWVLPESGFEVFWEWARDDHSWELRDLLLEPEYSQAYMLGLQKAMELSGNRILALRAEITHLQLNSTAYFRGGNPTYYYHGLVTPGYTHKGQVIGAGIGPGGNAQGLAADLYAPWGRAQLTLQRDVRDNDAYWDWALANNVGSCCHNVLYHLGADALFFVGDFDLGGGFIITREMNRYFYGLDYWNLNLSFSARWRPDGVTFP